MGEKLSVNELAEEFNVSIRTLRRDFNERLQYLDITLEQGKYKLSKDQVLYRSDKDIIKFAKIVHLESVFPSLDSKFLSLILSENSISPCVVYNNPPRTKPTIFGGFSRLSHAIIKTMVVSLIVNGCEYKNFSPYRLIYVEGEWHLVGVYLRNVTVLILSQITNVVLNDLQFDVDHKLVEMCTKEEFMKALPHFGIITELLTQ